jgi:hypothetical protein
MWYNKVEELDGVMGMARDWLRVRLPQWFPDQAWLDQVIVEVQRWSQRVLGMSGLLAEV